MNRILSAVLLMAAFLWSSVCFAQCRILPTPASSQKKQLPPCHKQHPQQQQSQEECQEKAASCFATVPEPESQLAILMPAEAPLTLAAPIAEPTWLLTVAYAPLEVRLHARPFILRI